jgi:hypothetical protein
MFVEGHKNKKVNGINEYTIVVVPGKGDILFSLKMKGSMPVLTLGYDRHAGSVSF